MITYSNSDLFLQDSVHKNLIITDGTVTVSGSTYSVTGNTFKITNDLLDQEGFSLTQYLCSDSELKYGSCNAACLQFTMHENIPSIKGKTVKVYMYLNNDVSTMLQLGVFKVDEDKLSGDRTVRNVTAYDAMYRVLHTDVKAWYNSILPNSSSSTTLLNFRNSFLQYFGITANTATLVNDSMTVKRTVEPDELLGGDVIKAICEINGVFGMIDHLGKFRYVELSPDMDAGLFPSDTLYPSNSLYPSDPNPNVDQVLRSQYSSVTFEDWMCEGITQLIVRESSDDVGVTVGTSGNTYAIEGNFLTYGKDSTTLTSIANNTLQKMVRRYYKPCSVNCVGNPLHEVGDPIRIRTTYRGIVTYIMQRTLTGIQSLKDTYKASGEEYYTTEVKSVQTQIKQLAGKTASLKVNADSIEGRVEDIEDGSASVIQQLSNGISLKVSKTDIVSDLDAQMSGINIESNKIEVTSSGTFTVASTHFNLDSEGNLSLVNDSGFTKGTLKVSSYNGISTLEVQSTKISIKGGSLDLIDIDGANQKITMSNTYLSATGGQINGSTIITASNVGSYAVTPSALSQMGVITSSNIGNQTCGGLTASVLSGDTPTIGTIRQANGNGVYSNKTLYWKQLQNVNATDFVVCAM